MKKLLFTFTAILLLVGCSMGNSSRSWDPYRRPKIYQGYLFTDGARILINQVARRQGWLPPEQKALFICPLWFEDKIHQVDYFEQGACTFNRQFGCVMHPYRLRRDYSQVMMASIPLGWEILPTIFLDGSDTCPTCCCHYGPIVYLNRAWRKEIDKELWFYLADLLLGDFYDPVRYVPLDQTISGVSTCTILWKNPLAKRSVIQDCAQFLVVIIHAWTYVNTMGDWESQQERCFGIRIILEVVCEKSDHYFLYFFSTNRTMFHDFVNRF